MVGRREITWEVGGQTADGRTGAKSGEVFFGRTDGRTVDGGQKEMLKLRFRVARFFAAVSWKDF